MPPSSAATVRVSHLDVMHSRTRITTVIGPVQLPDDATIAAGLRTMAEAGPQTRLGLRPSTRGNRWAYDPEAFSPVVTRIDPPASPMDLLDLPAIGSAEERPTSITLAGNYIRTDHNHGLGEVALTLMIHGIALGMIDPTDQRVWESARASRSGITTAALRTYGSDPRRAWALRQSLEGPTRTAPPNHPASPWTPERTGTVVTTDPDTLQALRGWRDQHLPSVSMFAVTASVLHRALADAGVTISPVAMITLDARRYLPHGRVPLGNFVSGLEFDLGLNPTPQQLHRASSNAVSTGRPVANLALNALRTRIGSRRSKSGAYPVTHPSTPQARLLFTSLGTVPRQGAIAWLDTAAPLYAAHNDPAGPEGITLTWALVDGGIQTTASFHGNVFPHSAVSAALNHAATDPFAFLTAGR